MTLTVTDLANYGTMYGATYTCIQNGTASGDGNAGNLDRTTTNRLQQKR